MSSAALRDTSESLRIYCVSRPFLLEERSGKSSYRRLFACISEEDDGYTVRVRLYDQTQQNRAHGEEIANALETASMLIAALAAEFSIPQACIKLKY
jgi:hypothetical protein